MLVLHQLAALALTDNRAIPVLLNSITISLGAFYFYMLFSL
jgi:hypothetical protein